MKTRLVLTGGGSGGHIYPGIAAAQYLVESGVLHQEELLWICSEKQQDQAILRSYGIPFKTIPSGKLRRYLSVRNFSDIGRIAAGFFAALAILKKLRPECVFSKGGYVSVPVVYAAWVLGIPVVSHESDFDPGLATRMNLFASRIICVPYEESASLYRRCSRVRVTGNPMGRTSPKGESIKIPEDRPCVLVHGGSLGSCSLNTLIWELLGHFPKDVTVVHVLGTGEHRKVPEREGYYPVQYLEGSFDSVLDRSDLVISRAGAGALWEQAASRKAMVLFPLGSRGSRGEQERNARYFERHTAALCFYSHALDTQQVIYDILNLLGDPERRKDLADRAASLVHEEGARLVACCISEYLEPKTK